MCRGTLSALRVYTVERWRDFVETVNSWACHPRDACIIALDESLNFRDFNVEGEVVHVLLAPLRPPVFHSILDIPVLFRFGSERNGNVSSKRTGRCISLATCARNICFVDHVLQIWQSPCCCTTERHSNYTRNNDYLQSPTTDTWLSQCGSNTQWERFHEQWADISPH